jgi:hypothetical protein
MRECRGLQVPAPTRALAINRKTLLPNRIASLVIKPNHQKHFPAPLMPGTVGAFQLIPHPNGRTRRIGALPK